MEPKKEITLKFYGIKVDGKYKKYFVADNENEAKEIFKQIYGVYKTELMENVLLVYMGTLHPYIFKTIGKYNELNSVAQEPYLSATEPTLELRPVLEDITAKKESEK